MRYVGVQTFGGGLDLGLAQAGLELVHRAEQKGGFGLAQCDANRHLLGQDWTMEAGEPASWVPFDDIQLVASLPPCSGFSLMSIRAGNTGGGRADYRGEHAPVNSCMWATMEYAARVNGGIGPDLVVMESVQGAGKDTPKGGARLMRQLRDHLENLTKSQYDMTHLFHNAASVGGCSIRRRYFLVLHRIPFGIESPHIERVPTLNEAIGDLAVSGDNWKDTYTAEPNFWTKPRRNRGAFTTGMQTFEHTGREVRHFERVNGILGAGDWGPGEQMIDVAHRYFDEHGDFPPGWGEQAQATALRTNWQGGVYQPQRWRGDKTGRVLAGNGMSCIIHPFLDRTLTFREAARIVGFPDDWNLDTYTTNPGVFGKAVTVPCGRWVGEWARRALDGDPGKWFGTEIGDREYKLDVTNDFKAVYDERTGEARDSRSDALKKEMAGRPA